MGCGASVEVDSNGRPKCSAIVKRRVLILAKHPNRNWRGQPAPGSQYQLDHDIEFNAKDLAGYRIVRPLECTLELVGIVSEQMKGTKYHDWTFICQLRDGTKKLLPSSAVEAGDQPQPGVVLIQKVSFCRCGTPENHDLTQTAEGEVQGLEESSGSQQMPAWDRTEISQDPPRYQKLV